MAELVERARGANQLDLVRDTTTGKGEGAASSPPTPGLLDGYRFWVAQAAVWSAFWFQGLFQNLERNRLQNVEADFDWLLLYHLLPSAIGFAITSLFRAMFLRLPDLDAKRYILIALAACATGSVLFAVVHFELKYRLGFIDQSLLLDWRSWLSYAPSRFIVLGSWTAVYLAIVSLSEATRHRERSRRLEAASAEARSQMLRYQVNPHLLFNALNTISGHVLNRDFDVADRAIQSLSRLLRFSLADSDATAITLRQEIHLVSLYLDVERTRFDDRMHVDIDIPESLERVLVPPLILQPLVENAMKHGIARCAEGGTISIVGKRSGNVAELTLENTCPGDQHATEPKTPQTDSFGLGINNVVERLAVFFGPEASLQLRPASDTFVAILRFPVVHTPGERP